MAAIIRQMNVYGRIFMKFGIKRYFDPRISNLTFFLRYFQMQYGRLKMAAVICKVTGYG